MKKELTLNEAITGILLNERKYTLLQRLGNSISDTRFLSNMILPDIGHRIASVGHFDHNYGKATPDDYAAFYKPLFKKHLGTNDLKFCFRTSSLKLTKDIKKKCHTWKDLIGLVVSGDIIHGKTKQRDSSACFFVVYPKHDSDKFNFICGIMQRLGGNYCGYYTCHIDAFLGVDDEFEQAAMWDVNRWNRYHVNNHEELQRKVKEIPHLMSWYDKQKAAEPVKLEKYDHYKHYKTVKEMDDFVKLNGMLELKF